jgi:hypothetical protein
MHPSEAKRQLALLTVLGTVSGLLAACQTHRLAEPTPELSGGTSDIYQASVNRDLDVLFVIDDSSSMAPLQRKLAASFPVFIDVLEHLPGGLPNLHLAVVSSSMGAGRNASIEGCPPGGDHGAFRAGPVGVTCDRGQLLPGQTFISNVRGHVNYTGDLADAFGCIAALGDHGCGFEHPFASALRALGADGHPAPPENAHFLRENAYLLVVLITNEDDCSAPPDSALFDSSSALVSDPLGPLTSYRCNEFGHSCGGHPPPRTPADLSDTCHSAEDGRLLRVADVVAALKGLKADPSKVFVSAIAGPKAPYVVGTTDAELADVAPWPIIQPSCSQTEADGALTSGDPAVRVADWVNAFGPNGVFESICAGSFAPALQAIAIRTGDSLDPGCVGGDVLDTNGALWTGTTSPDCVVVDHAFSESGAQVDSILPACPAGEPAGPTACWSLETSPPACGERPFVRFNRPGASSPFDLYTTVTCSVRVCPPHGTPGAPDGC